MTRPPRLAFVLVLPAVLSACTGAPPQDEGSAPATPSAAAGPATNAPPTPTAAASPAQPDDGCGASKVARWIGHSASASVREAVQKGSGAVSVRWLYPDSIVTQDFAPERLNVVMDKASDIIVSARCG